MAEPAGRKADSAAAGTVWYDGGCPVCRREIGLYRGLAGAETVAWQDISNGPVPEGMSRERLLGRFTVRRRDGRIADGAAGFIALWRALRPLAPLGRLVDHRPGHRAGDVIYAGFLRLRRLWRRPDRQASDRVGP